MWVRSVSGPDRGCLFYILSQDVWGPEMTFQDSMSIGLFRGPLFLLTAADKLRFKEAVVRGWLLGWEGSSGGKWWL